MSLTGERELTTLPINSNSNGLLTCVTPAASKAAANRTAPVTLTPTSCACNDKRQVAAHAANAAAAAAVALTHKGILYNANWEIKEVRKEV
ncbi:MAG: hypothetical protein ACRDAX_00995 [Propionibacteriaceae bacterium]